MFPVSVFIPLTNHLCRNWFILFLMLPINLETSKENQGEVSIKIFFSLLTLSVDKIRAIRLHSAV